MGTALSIIQQVCYEVGTPAPTSIYNVTDPGELQLKNLLYAEARNLRRLRQWPQQKKLHTFTTTDDRTKYPLPVDFYSMSGRTLWDQTRSLPLEAPVDDEEWQYRQYLYTGVGPTYGIRIFGPDSNAATSGGQFQIDQDPGSSTYTLSFEYISKNLFYPTAWVASTAFAVNSYCFANGNIYKTTAGGTTGSTIPSHTTGSASDGGVTWVYQSIAYETILADTDTCVFDDDVLIKGVTWRWRKAHDLAFDADYAEYQDMINSAKSRWNGSYRSSMSRYGKGFSAGPVVPLRNWGI